MKRMKQGRQGGNNMRKRDGQRKIGKILLFVVYKGDRRLISDFTHFIYLFLIIFFFPFCSLALLFILSLYVVYHLTYLFPISTCATSIQKTEDRKNESE